jgi:uncharacterized protein YbbK (DUF523 family)
MPAEPDDEAVPRRMPVKIDLDVRYRLLHGEREGARAELKRLAASGKEVVVVSACLCGIRCRFDGRDKRMDEVVARAVGDGEVLPLCPEVLAGFGTPRPAITLSADGKKASSAKGEDVTQTLEAGARLADLFAQEAGAKRALLKERSPSCGVRKVHGADGLVDGEGRFAARLKKRGLVVVSEQE